MNKKVHFIINPASGKPHPILHTINRLCNKHNVEYQLGITQANTMDQVIENAVAGDSDVIAVYGGDGTIARVAGAVAQANKVLAIIPGGTANVLSIELGVPRDFERACELICMDQYVVKKIDIGQINGHTFTLRVGLGFEAELIKGADRTSKNKLGVMAYALSSVKAVFKTSLVKYEMTIDGQSVKSKGLSLVIANSGNLGIPGVKFFPDINITDGLLDVILLKPADIKNIILKDQETEMNSLSLFQHWKAKQLTIHKGHAQSVQYDGEMLDSEEVEIKLLSQQVSIAVPK